ncbi:hypothetical protein [Pseudonocardia sp. ICBG1293]|uniref:MinD/ParA family ATP-binding protein n=1 Tax=Pseudonocardia sp. ICBG1293 TaxID=2844382 RepID=UPI001CCC9A32|nr:hypothetical protein [Pseudonocardia sp. ICBG1293]
MRRPQLRSASLPWDNGTSTDCGLEEERDVAPQAGSRSPGQAAEPPGRSGRVLDRLPPRDPGAGSRLNALRPRQSAPTTGWRAAAFKLSGGKWNPGPSAAEDRYTGLIRRICDTRLEGPHSVIVGTLTQDGASRAQRTLDYLANYRDVTGGFPHRHLVNDAVVVLSGDRWSQSIDADVIRNYFRGRVRSVLELPADRHLASGGPIELALLQPATRDAVLEIAATVADGFYGRTTHGLASHGFRNDDHR